MPLEAGEIYHVVSAEWWENWRAYTKYDSVGSSNVEEQKTPGDIDMTNTTDTADPSATDQENSQQVEDTPKQKPSHPGEINS